MAEENATTTDTTTTDGKTGDSLTNLKSEMDRKFQNIAENLKTMTEELKSQLTSLKPVTAEPKVKTSPKPFREKFYEDEDAAVAELKEQTKNEIREELQLSNKQNQVLQSLYNDFPELADASNALTKRAVEIHKTLDKTEQMSPTSYRFAVLEAAAELDVIPVKKRKSNQDDFTGMGNDGAPSKKAAKKAADDLTMSFAEAMGLNTSDPKVAERLKKRSERKNWSTYSE